MAFDTDQYEANCQSSFDCRTAAWSTLGTVDSDLLTYMARPGGPPWPSGRQAYRVVRGPQGICIASDGLSDPFDATWADGSPELINGFGVEVYAIADTLPDTTMGRPIASSWLFPLVTNAAYYAAKYTLVPLLEELGSLSTEFYDIPIPDEHASRFITERDTVGVILGMQAPPVPKTIDGPLSEIRPLHVMLLTADEMTYIMTNKDKGRAELVRRFVETDTPLVSSLTRDSVV